MIRSCALGDGCYSRQRANEGPLRAYVGETPGLCDPCTEMIRADVRALPRDYVDLSILARTRAGRRRAQTAGIRPADVLSFVPLDEICESACRSIYWALTCWEQVVRDRAELSDVDYTQVRPGWAVDSCVRFIANRLDLLAATPLTHGFFDGPDEAIVQRDGADAIEQLRRCHRRAMAILDLTDPVTHMPGPCPQCGDAALRRRAEEEWVYCHACRHRLPHGDYPKIILAQLGVDTFA